MKTPITIGSVLCAALLITSCTNENTAQPGVGSTTQASASDSSTLQTSTTSDSNDTCTTPSETEIAALFDRWNDDLKSGDPAKVAENYASESVLLPTVSNQVRLTNAEKEDYFQHWLEKKPDGVVNERWIERDCNHAIDAGTYTFTYGDGSKVAARYTFVYELEDREWKIVSHHSSAMPEENPDTELPPATQATGSPPAVENMDKCAADNSDAEISALLDRWFESLKTGDSKKVVENYADSSVLLPTVSNKVRFSAEEKEDYFNHFLEKKPVGTVDDRWIEADCNTATDSGLYTFTYEDGTQTKARYTFTYRWDGEQWRITSHHSSAMPEKV
ncbi:MAG: SgcJ/EcaC family oxidoreductase [Corynebacterium sp.]|nr:SgcJ/EcaC family oxidoreductase [Corynebacterium sp.]